MLKADHPFSLVLFGASGHLAKIKIFPAIYFLALKKRLPAQYSIVGYARTTMDDAAFRKDFADAVNTYVPEVNAKVLEELLTHVLYQPGQYDQQADFVSLSARLNGLENGWTNHVRLAYMSVPPSVFPSVVKNLCAGKVHDHGRDMDFRCIVEKPVGGNAKTFKEVRDLLFSCFDEDEVYILDHYLGKEAVRNAYYLRYANPVIESLLGKSLVTHVQITASETAGLEGRAGYFDAVGTLRDMFQSHLIQIAALLTMPLTPGDGIKIARLEAVKKFALPSKNLADVVMQGQYDKGEIAGKSVPAYRDEQGVSPGSRTATFASMKLVSTAPQWKGVPFFLHSGKRLNVKETRIAIEFRDAAGLAGKQDCHKNRLDIILQGEAGMKLYLQTKLGGSEPRFRPLVMEDPLVCMGDCLVEHSLLLLEAINGNRQWFLDPLEVEACWKLIDPLQKYLDDPSTPLALYPSGSKGPKEANDFIAKDGFEWF